MSDKSYFIVRSGEDGTSIEGPLTKEEVVRRITPASEGYTHYGPNLSFLDKIPPNDKGYWCCGTKNPIVIIEGSIVVPKPVQVVQQFEL